MGIAQPAKEPLAQGDGEGEMRPHRSPEADLFLQNFEADKKPTDAANTATPADLSKFSAQVHGAAITAFVQGEGLDTGHVAMNGEVFMPGIAAGHPPLQSTVFQANESHDPLIDELRPAFWEAWDPSKGKAVAETPKKPVDTRIEHDNLFGRPNPPPPPRKSSKKTPTYKPEIDLPPDDR